MLALALGAIWPRPALNKGTVAYTDKEFGFRVEYPGEWVQKELQGVPIPDGSHAPLTIALINGDEVSMCSLSVASFDASKLYQRGDIISRMMDPGLFAEVLHDTMPRGRVLNLQRGFFGGKDASIAVVGNTVPVRQFMINFTGVMATTVYNGYVYRGYCYSDEKTFPKMEKQLRSVLDAFSFTQPEVPANIQAILAALAAEQKTTLPRKLDELTTMVDVHAEGNVMNYRYVLALDMKKGGDIAGFERDIRGTMCTPELKELLKAGGSFRFTYQDRKSNFIHTVRIQSGDCG
jgi:hypothetical protein